MRTPGKPQWSFYSTPPPGQSEPKSGGATGGQMWNTGTYDPDLNLMFVGTGNPDAGPERRGAPRRQSLDLQYRCAESRHR